MTIFLVLAKSRKPPAFTSASSTVVGITRGYEPVLLHFTVDEILLAVHPFHPYGDFRVYHDFLQDRPRCWRPTAPASSRRLNLAQQGHR